MRISADRILTTHVGSLPRPQDVVDLLWAQDRGASHDVGRFSEVMKRAVQDAVNQQTGSGLDIVNDGEMAKIGYATYMRHRLTGFELGEVPRATPQDLDDYPEYRDKIAAAGDTPKYKRPICRGPILVKDLTPLLEDIARLQEALVEAADGGIAARRAQRPHGERHADGSSPTPDGAATARRAALAVERRSPRERGDLPMREPPELGQLRQHRQ